MTQAQPRGDMPNVSWRSISIDHVRSHPLFHPLPHPDLLAVGALQDLMKFRQHTWQWDALHQGRLTTSRLSAVLGVYESKSASFLGVPKSLQGHSKVLSAFNHLRQKPPPHWNHLYQSQTLSISPLPELSSPVWQEKEEQDSQLAKYSYCPSPGTENAVYKMNDELEVRLAWGEEQEATALLNVINYVHSVDATAKVKEVGMCTFEGISEVCDVPANYLDFRDTNMYYEIYHRIYREEGLPLIGASPDGLIERQDGTVEVVEIKCHSPFISGGTEDGRFSVAFRKHRGHAIPTWHIPQIMMEMFCAGPRCHSALLMSFYAEGAKIFRILRDDEVS